MNFRRFILEADMPGMAPTGPMPPGGPMGAPPGMPPAPGGLGGMPPGPMGGGPPGGMPPGPMGGGGGGGQLNPQKNLIMKHTDVWSVLEELLGGESDGNPSKHELESEPTKHLMK